MTDRTGQCLCGAVRFSIRDGRDDFGVCHCKMCQRWTGGMFPGIVYPADQVTITGRERVVDYQSSPEAVRSFCKVCGSTLWFRDVKDGQVEPYYEIAVGLLDDTDGLVLSHEVFVDRKPAGWSLAGDHPRDTEADYLRRKAEQA